MDWTAFFKTLIDPNHFHIRKMISKMRYKTFYYRSTFWWLPFICLGSPIRTTSTFSLENNLLKGNGSCTGMVVNRSYDLHFISHAIPVRFVRNLLSTLGIFFSKITLLLFDSDARILCSSSFFSNDLYFVMKNIQKLLTLFQYNSCNRCNLELNKFNGIY
jgi:hypothetical protein